MTLGFQIIFLNQLMRLLELQFIPRKITQKNRTFPELCVPGLDRSGRKASPLQGGHVASSPWCATAPSAEQGWLRNRIVNQECVCIYTYTYIYIYMYMNVYICMYAREGGTKARPQFFQYAPPDVAPR